MSDPFYSEIRPFGFNFAPKGWGLCNGTIMAISQNQALYSLLGTRFGGDGRSNFALPELRGRAPIGRGDFVSPIDGSVVNYSIGEAIGTETVSLSEAEMASHTHAIQATETDASISPKFTDQVFAQSINTKIVSTDDSVYTSPSNLTELAVDIVSSVGAGNPHENLQPLLALNFCIALEGAYPARN